ncbi:MAG: ABC transporter permease [Chloroflexi bacterium]|nr:ABC transporter permease [Chloroflexota bacterium]
MTLPEVSRRSYRMWQRNRDVFLRLWKAELVPFVAEPLIILAAMGFGLGGLVGKVNGQSYLAFVAPGVLASYVMFAAAFECTYGTYVRMERQRTFDAIIVTPLSIEDVITGEILWGATRSFLTACAILVVILIFGLVPSPYAAIIPVLAILEGLMFSSISVFFTSLAPSIYFFNYFFTLFITPMFFFSGVFFPISRLPEVIQTMTWMLPLTPAAHAMRELLWGQWSWGVFAAMAWILGVTLVFFYLSLIFMRRRLIK